MISKSFTHTRPFERMEHGMKGFLFAILLLTLPFLGTASADPLPLAEDLTDTVRYPIGSGAVSYIYSYTYPQVDETDPSAGLINEFYRYTVSDALDFEVPMNVDYYTSVLPENDVFVTITYEITCNNDDYFALLIKTEGNDFLTYSGHTFSRRDIRPGSSVALPYLLGILSDEENDTWLEDRQTAKADALVRSMIWDQLQKTKKEIGLFEDFTEESLELAFYPEEDFYLDKTGNPVFYLQPGKAADPALGLLTFPISIEEILDEI